MGGGRSIRRQQCESRLHSKAIAAPTKTPGGETLVCQLPRPPPPPIPTLLVLAFPAPTPPSPTRLLLASSNLQPQPPAPLSSLSLAHSTAWSLSPACCRLMLPFLEMMTATRGILVWLLGPRLSLTHSFVSHSFFIIPPPP